MNLGASSPTNISATVLGEQHNWYCQTDIPTRQRPGIQSIQTRYTEYTDQVYRVYRLPGIQSIQSIQTGIQYSGWCVYRQVYRYYITRYTDSYRQPSAHIAPEAPENHRYRTKCVSTSRAIIVTGKIRS